MGERGRREAGERGTQAIALRSHFGFIPGEHETMTCSVKARSARMSLVAGMLALSSSAESAASSCVIKCEGPFGRNAGHSDLVKAFGSKNVVDQEIDGVEGQKIKASVLYPDDPKARLEFVWSDEKARRRPTLIRATDQSAWAT